MTYTIVVGNEGQPAAGLAVTVTDQHGDRILEVAGHRDINDAIPVEIVGCQKP